MTRNSFAKSLRNGAGGLCLALLAGLAFASAGQAQTGTVSGLVTEAGSGRPLASAQVYIEGTALGTLTNSSGRYLFVNAPVGEHTVIAELVGYRAASQTVTVANGQAIAVNFGLTVTAIQLDQIVVTGTGVATEKKKLGNTIATVDVSKLRDAPITSFSDVLQGREAGVVGLPGGGETGASGRIRIRGSASLSQSNEPIIYLDGVRIDTGSMGGWGAAQAATRRFDDIDPNSIERIEILKGAAAATLYGTEASNGVIQIFTKRGQQGAPRWTVQTDQTAVSAPFDRFVPHADFPRDAEQVARMQHRWGVSLQPYEVFETDYMSELYNTGYGQTYSASVSGGADLITYFASGRYYNENGPFSTLDGVFADGGQAQERGHDRSPPGNHEHQHLPLRQPAPAGHRPVLGVEPEFAGGREQHLRGLLPGAHGPASACGRQQPLRQPRLCDPAGDRRTRHQGGSGALPGFGQRELDHRRGPRL